MKKNNKFIEFSDVEEQLKEYCDNNDLSFEKLKTLENAWGIDRLSFYYHDKSFTLSDTEYYEDIPCPVALFIERVNGELIFTQTEHTQKYLAL